MNATTETDTVKIMAELDTILPKGESAELIPLPENTKFNAEIRAHCRTTRNTAELLIRNYNFQLKVNQGDNPFRIVLQKYVK